MALKLWLRRVAVVIGVAIAAVVVIMALAIWWATHSISQQKKQEQAEIARVAALTPEQRAAEEEKKAAEAEKYRAEQAEAKARLEKWKAEQPEREAAEAKAKAEKEAAEAKAKAEAPAEFKRLLARMERSRDEVEHITFFKPRNRQRSGTFIAPYVGLPDSGPVYLRTVMQYGGSDWIFFKTIKVSIDGETLPARPFGYFKVERDHSGGSVWEWVDVSVKDADVPLLERIANSKNVIIRFEGKYYEDLKVTDAMKQSIRDTLQFYQLLKSGMRPPPDEIRKPKAATRGGG